MGSAASLSPEVFTIAKEEYEARKNDGLSDEQLFNHMKDFIELRINGTSSMEEPIQAEVVVEATVEAAVLEEQQQEPPPVDDAGAVEQN
jgi:hypothetical protein